MNTILVLLWQSPDWPFLRILWISSNIWRLSKLGSMCSGCLLQLDVSVVSFFISTDPTKEVQTEIHLELFFLMYRTSAFFNGLDTTSEICLESLFWHNMMNGNNLMVRTLQLPLLQLELDIQGSERTWFNSRSNCFD